MNKRDLLNKISDELGNGYSEVVEKMSDQEIDSLTEDANIDIDKLIEILGNERSDRSKKILDLPSNNSVLKIPPKEYIDSINDSKEKYGNDAIPAKVNIDPLTGKYNISTVMSDDNIKDVSLDNILDGETIKENDVEDILKSNFGDDIDGKDMIEVINFINKVEKEKPNKLYNILPSIIKKSIDEVMLTATIEQKEMAAFEFYNMFRTEIALNREFIELEEAIKRETDIPDITDMYLDHIRQVMEIDIIKKADEINTLSPTKSNILREMSKAFTDAYTYETLKNKIKNKKRIINKELTKELKNYDHHCAKFNAKYKSSKFVITDIRSLIYILDRKLPDDNISLDDIKKFIILMCKIFRKMSPDDLVQHTYMYYSTKLIESLDHIDSPKTEISNTIINNIIEVINLINSK